MSRKHNIIAKDYVVALLNGKIKNQNASINNIPGNRSTILVDECLQQQHLDIDRACFEKTENEKRAVIAIKKSHNKLVRESLVKSRFNNFVNIEDMVSVFKTFNNSTRGLNVVLFEVKK